MKVAVKDIMVRDARFCRPDTNLAEIAGIMWDQGCGALPVVDNGALIGMITDRDICIALGTRNLRASDITAREVGGARYFACKPDDDISTALKTMEAQGVHRLPVVDPEGKLAGVLSIDDVIVYAAEQSGIEPSDAMTTLKGICGKRRMPHGELTAVA